MKRRQSLHEKKTKNFQPFGNVNHSENHSHFDSMNRKYAAPLILNNK